MNDIAVTEWIERDEGGRIADEMRTLTSYSGTGVIELQKTNMPVPVGRYIPADVLMSMRLTYAAYTLKNLVEISLDKAAGVPVLVGTKFTVARIIAEIADGMSVSKLAREFDLNKDHIAEMLHGIAITLDRPFV
jgi:uncharacterized protein (DUF433 family)